MFFRIGELATLIGVEAHVLRYWESEFRIRPQRSPAGQRMYTRKDISRFLRIKNLLYKQGFTIAGARRAMDAAMTDPDAASFTADVDQVSAALARVERLRQRVVALRDDAASTWDEHVG
jgi:DNA-binding transcriptional MerR regulator